LQLFAQATFAYVQLVGKPFFAAPFGFEPAANDFPNMKDSMPH
jgi:hypothetical protein